MLNGGRLAGFLLLLGMPCLHAVSSRTAQETFFQNHQLADLLFTKDLLFQTTARSNLDCLRQCFKNRCCVMHTYAKPKETGGGVCRGHFAMMTRGSSSTKPCPGCRTFYKVTQIVPPKNVAYGKRATQSSTYSLTRSSAGKAVDNNTAPDFYENSCAVTRDQKSWWQVDLGNNYYVTSVVITNMGDYPGANLRNFDVSVYTQYPSKYFSAKPTLCYHYTGTMAYEATETLVCSTRRVWGRFLRVTNEPGFKLQLCEVQVFAGPTLC